MLLLITIMIHTTIISILITIRLQCTTLDTDTANLQFHGYFEINSFKIDYLIYFNINVPVIPN